MSARGKPRALPPTERAQAAQRIAKAKDSLVRAAAALTNSPCTTDDLAAALMEASVALVHIAAADTDERARGKVQAVIDRVLAERRQSNDGQDG